MPKKQAAVILEPSEKQVNFFVCLTAATAALAGLLFGFDTGVISGAILFIKGEFALTPFTEELLVSAALLGAVCGAALSGRITDLGGRKRTIFGTACIFCRWIGSVCRGYEHRSLDRGTDRSRSRDWCRILYRPTLHR